MNKDCVDALLHKGRVNTAIQLIDCQLGHNHSLSQQEREHLEKSRKDLAGDEWTALDKVYEACITDITLRKEELGDGDLVFRGQKDFPLVFTTNRFGGGYDLYKVNSLEHYQDFLFNDKFMAVGSPYKPMANANNLKEVEDKAKKLLR